MLTQTRFNSWNHIHLVIQISRELEMERNSLNEALSVDTQNKDILVERNAAYQTVVCPQTDEGDYEIII